MGRISWPHPCASISFPSEPAGQLHPCTLLGEARRATLSPGGPFRQDFAFRTLTFFKYATGVCCLLVGGTNVTRHLLSHGPALLEHCALSQSDSIHFQLLEPQHTNDLCQKNKKKNKLKAIAKPRQLESSTLVSSRQVGKHKLLLKGLPCAKRHAKYLTLPTSVTPQADTGLLPSLQRQLLSLPESRGEGQCSRNAMFLPQTPSSRISQT